MTAAPTPLRLLIVEDNPADAELVVIELERAGYAPSTRRVASAAELRDALKEPWQIVVSDYGMQGFDALAALAIVREVAGDLPFIIVSGSVGEELAVRAMKAGANDFFLKDRLERLASAIAREVTEARLRFERSEALDRLQSSEARLRALVEQVLIGIVQTDLHGRITFVNQRFAEIVARTPEELCALSERDITHPDDLDAYDRTLSQAGGAGRPIASTKRYVRPSGAEVWVNANVALVAASSTPPYLVAVVEDITERRRAERERERLLSELERTVKISEMFVGVLGHDLRNPLQTVSVAATLLLRKGTDPTVAAGRMLRATDRMRRMIDQLLDFTRMRMGMGIPLALGPLDLADVARSAVEEIVVGAETDEVELVVEGNAGGRWDRDRLLQLASNLVANAVDHREPGTPVRVRVDGRQPQGVVLEVQNRGEIPPDVFPLIFEPMQTTKRLKQDRASGLGLGLYITRQIARAHGGNIVVESDALRGTRFIVELPREPNVDGESLSRPSVELSAPDARGAIAIKTG